MSGVATLARSSRLEACIPIANLLASTVHPCNAGIGLDALLELVVA